MRYSERSVAPVLAVVLMVAVVVLIGASVTGFVLLIAESTSQPAPSAAFDTETTEDGTILLQHSAGDPIETDELDITGGEIRGEIPDTIDAGEEIEIAPSGERTDLVWQDDDSDDEAILNSVETSPHPLTATDTSKRWRTERADDEQRSNSWNRIRDLEATDDAVYVVGMRQEVRALYPENGSIEWIVDGVTTEFRSSSTSVDESDGIVYVGTSEVFEDGGDVTAVDASEEEIIWQHTFHNELDEDRGVDVTDLQEYNGVVYSLDNGGEIVATDAAGGDVLWNKTLWGIGTDTQALDVTDGVIYTGDRALDADDGSIIWEETDRHGTVSGVDENDGIVYVGDSRNDIVAAVDTSDGSILWEKESGGTRAVHVDRGVLYAGMNNRVVAMDADDGSILWSHDRHDETVSAIDVHDDVVYSTTRDNDDYTRSVELEFEDG